MPSPMHASGSLKPRWKPWFLLMLALVISATPALPLRAEDVIARLLEIQGSVDVRRKGASEWVKATQGQVLSPGDTVRTHGHSQASLLRPDGTTLELYPLSEATIEDEKAVMLWLGKIWSQFQKAVGRPHEIRTPSSVALIRGTVLAVEADSGGASEVSVVEGLVEVVDRQGERREMVGAGFAVRADREGRLSRLERARAETLNEGRGFMERLERRGIMRSHEGDPAKGPRGKEAHGDERGTQAQPRGEHHEERPRGDRHDARGPASERREEAAARRGEAAEKRIELRQKLEQRLERGAGERLERLIDRTQRDERREQAEQRREERLEQRQQERPEQAPERREQLLDRLQERLKKGL